MEKKAVWNNEEQYGCEYLTLTKESDHVVIESTVIYVAEESTHVHSTILSIPSGRRRITVLPLSLL